MSSYRTWYDPPRKGDEEPFPGSPDDMMNTVAALRAQNAEIVAERDIAWASNAGLTTDVLALRAENAALVAALEGLVGRLDEIHADPAYKSVWTVSQLHVGPYQGPTYVDALDSARAALAAAGHKP